MVGAWQAKTVGTESPYKQLRCKYDNKIILLNKIIKCIGIWLLWVSINMSWATDSLFKTEGRIIGILFQNLNQKISEIHYKQTTTVAKLSPAVSVVSAEIHRFLDGFPKLKIDSFFSQNTDTPFVWEMGLWPFVWEMGLCLSNNVWNWGTNAPGQFLLRNSSYLLDWCFD